MKFDVAAYIWPAYTGREPRALQFWEQGEGEWQTVKNPTKKPQWDFSDPRPLWGYVDEADSNVMEMQIQKALEHGVNVFIYDWYWYDGRPFLENCLNDGFLKAKNCGDMRFYIMWANHDATYLWDKRLSDVDSTVWRGGVDMLQFEKITDRIIENYFRLDNYYKIDGKPVFMIYDASNFINGLGGVANAEKALDRFRAKAKKAGFADIHLQLCAWSEHAVKLNTIDSERNMCTRDIVKALSFDSVTNYQFVHMTGDIDRDYNEIVNDVLVEYKRYKEEYDVPYFPHVSVGWDNNLRFTAFKPGIIKNNTKDNFKAALLKAKEFLKDTGSAPLVTINSWNEWTEGSYLEPDTIHGYDYLDAIKEVFCDE